jgi:hypothetical protein
MHIQRRSCQPNKPLVQPLYVITVKVHVWSGAWERASAQLPNVPPFLLDDFLHPKYDMHMLANTAEDHCSKELSVAT